MNIKSAVTTLSLLSVLSFGAFAADSVSRADAQNLQPIGTVSVSGVASSPMDMRAALEQKAQAQGATAWRVIEARQGDTWHATAELYK
ncbi:peroxide/acid stress response protein YhcN [Pantoea sp. 1.19]|uniref:peroxide/acid stress response protein YhcN n=1 Tax=Pantoea sp. 1.19 TaxID=1925589 RepID=UPI000948D10D|nr:peroxide/acid stress response protein YhcN [Pantoea sp. 1.19]